MSNTTPTPTPTPNTSHKPLNQASAAQLAHGYARYCQLNSELSSGIITPETATKTAERDGLEKHITATLFRHAGELLGAWNIVRTEYEPMLRSVATIFGRIGLLGGAADEKTPAPVPANVEPLPPTNT